MAEVVTMGETMAVLVPEEAGPLRYNERYRMRVAGAESNTAVGLVKLGHSAALISRLGDDELGQYILRELRGEGVDTRFVSLDPERPTGLMFKERGQRDTRVYYYRENSAASCLGKKAVLDLLEDSAGELLRGAKLVHLTGITPVLSGECREAAETLMGLARERGIPVSFDPNIRQKLWKGRDLRGEIRALAQQAQVVLLGLSEGEALFGSRSGEELLEEIFTKGKAQYVAVKDGEKGALVSDGKCTIRIAPYPCRPLEPVGAGDGFNAGFLGGYLEGRSLQEMGRMGGIAGALATETDGDYEGYPDRKQMERLLSGEQESSR